MKAGPELDALVAEKVMGWSDGPYTFYRWADRKKRKFPIEGIFHCAPSESLGDYASYVNERGEKFSCGEPKRIYLPHHYSTDIAAAEEVIRPILSGPLAEKHGGMGIVEIVWNPHWSYWRTKFSWFDGFHVEESAATAPLAICLAALAAVENKNP